MARTSTTGQQKTSKPVRGQCRSRTFTGCGTCRIRHVKCDEKTPICSPCKRLKLPCQGYAPRLLWLPPSLNNHGLEEKVSESKSFRYPLFSDSQRQSMTRGMVQSLGEQSVVDILLELENESVSGDHLREIGPFGVFRISQHQHQIQNLDQDASYEQPKQADERNLEGDKDNENDDEDIQELPLSPQSDSLLPFTSSNSPFLLSFTTSYQATSSPLVDPVGADNSVNVGTDLGMPWADISQAIPADLFNMEIRTPDLGPMEAVNGAGTSPTKPIQTPVQQTDGVITDVRSEVGLTSGNDRRQEPSALGKPMTLPNSSCIGVVSVLPPHAADLLRYLKTEVLGKSVSPINRGMSPWKMLLLPCTLETVAELSMWNETSHARRSVLSTLLAKGAFHLSQSPSQDESATAFWLKIGTDHQRDAQKQLDLALRNEVDGNIKYVELLMAILGVGIISFYFQGPEAIKKRLLVAERLIRGHGIPARKTLQHRILHHMYTHLRLLVESTNILPEPLSSGHGQETGPSPQLIETTAPRNFSIRPQNLGDLDLTRRKPDSIGYNDIHLDISGMWDATLYPEIFGVPETLMTLLSQTISLANGKPELEALAVRDPAVSVALNKHVNTLEQQICSWKLPSGPRIASSKISRGSAMYDQPLVENMILAMHQALIIFFYRRVHNLSCVIVQTQVKNTLELLQPCLETAGLDLDFAVSMGWSAFIAVCEAATSELQELGLKCLESVDDCGIFIEHGKPSTIVKAVWKRREDFNDFKFGWPDMIKLNTVIA